MKINYKWMILSVGILVEPPVIDRARTYFDLNEKPFISEYRAEQKLNEHPDSDIDDHTLYVLVKFYTLGD